MAIRGNQMEWLCARCRKKYEREVTKLRRNPVYDELFEAVVVGETARTPLYAFEDSPAANNFRRELYRYRKRLAECGDATYRDQINLTVEPIDNEYVVCGYRRDRYPRKGRPLVDVGAEILALDERLDALEDN